MVQLQPIKTGQRVTEEETAEEPLSPGARLFHAPRLNCCIIAEMGIKTAIDVDTLKEGINHSLLKHPRFTSKLVFDAKSGKPVGWVQTKVNVDDHIFIPDLDPDMDSPDQFVEDYVSNITKTRMDFSKPLWEFHILHIKSSKANSVVILRIHHSIGDGISLISLLLACTRKSSDLEALPTLPIDKKNKMKINSQANSWFLRCFFSLLFILKVFWNTLVDLVLFLATIMCLKDTNTPLKGSSGIESTPKRFVHKTFSLDDIKLVKSAMDMTINDVILGITQAGLSRYLNRNYGKVKPGEKVMKNNLPEHIRLRATLLVNLRPTTTIEGLAEKMEGDSNGKWQWGNSIGYIHLPFHIALRDDPLEYIRDAKTTINRKKESLEAPSTYAIARFILNTLGLGVLANLTYRVLFNTTLSFSNVVGPSDEISFYGHPLAYLAPSVYGHPQALTIHFQSYIDMMTLVLAVDEDVIPDPHKLCDDILESLQLAKNAIIERKLTKS